jgi:hypothetical protein
MMDDAVPMGLIHDRRHARCVEGWAKRHPDDPRHQAILLELLVFDWRDRCDRPLSDHGRLELAVAFLRGRPLNPSEPVPGCSCDGCTGIPTMVPAAGATSPFSGAKLPPLDIEAARAVPILQVAATLGIEHRNHWATCPFHADGTPSLHLNPEKNKAFCNPCGRRWDGIALVMEYQNLTFPNAIEMLNHR